MTAVEMVIPGQRYTVTGGGYSTNGQITRVGGKATIELEPYLLPMALASDAVAKDGELVGDPTEGALVVLAAKGGIDAVTTRQEYPRVAEVPFDAAYKLMATFHRMTGDDGREVIRCFVKGAPDQLLTRSSHTWMRNNTRYQLTPCAPSMLRTMSGLANRVCASWPLRVATSIQRQFDPSADLLAQVKGLTMLALIGIVDPPRPEAKTSIAKARSAGIQVRMITGDHAVTAGAIAQQLGIPGRAISGADFAAMSDEEALRQVDEIGVIARVTPEHKVRLVEILKKAHKIVAMTGDGVNDAPALKKADIGVAMGVTGTDVAKEAAVMILTDDNFATIIRAVESGRALYDNLMKYIRFQMGSLFAFIITFLGAALFNILSGVPFLPLQALWINFTIDILLSIGLGLGNPTPGLMQRRPRKANAQILPARLLARLVLVGLILAACTLGVMQYAIVSAHVNTTVAHTMGMTVFSLASIFYALETNDELRSVFNHETLREYRLLQTCGWSLLATFLVTAPDFMNRLFQTSGLTIGEWVICIVVGSVILWVIEIAKIFRRRAAASSTASYDTCSGR